MKRWKTCFLFFLSKQLPWGECSHEAVEGAVSKVDERRHVDSEMATRVSLLCSSKRNLNGNESKSVRLALRCLQLAIEERIQHPPRRKILAFQSCLDAFSNAKICIRLQNLVLSPTRSPPQWGQKPRGGGSAALLWVLTYSHQMRRSNSEIARQMSRAKWFIEYFILSERASKSP